MNSGIDADKEAAFEQNIVDTAELDAKVTTAAGNITLLEEGKLDKRTEGFEVYSHTDDEQGALLVKQSSSGVLADASLLTEKAISDDLKKKLSLSGGTMTGTIITEVNIALKRELDDADLHIYSGTALNKGASLLMNGKDRTYDPGAFKLYATDGTNTKELKGKPDGSLTWNGYSLTATSTALTMTLSGSTEISINANESRLFKIANLCIVYVNVTLATKIAFTSDNQYYKTLSTTFAGTLKTELAKVKSSDSAHIALAAINQAGNYPVDGVDFYNVTSSNANIRISARNGIASSQYIRVQGTFVYLA